MSKTHPNLAIKSLADLQQRKEQLRLETLAAKQAALDSAKPIQLKASGLLMEKVAPIVATAAALGIAYKLFERKKPKPAYAAPQNPKTTSSWIALAKFALPLLKTALPLIQKWYANYQERIARPN